AFDSGLLNVGALHGKSRGKSSIERFVQIDDHHDAGLNRDSEQGDIADPHCNTEVITKVPLEQKSPRQSVERRKDQDQRFGHRAEHHVEQQKDGDEDNRQNDLEPLFGAQFELIFAGPFQAIADWQLKLFLKMAVGASDEAAIIPCVQIEINIAGK